MEVPALLIFAEDFPRRNFGDWLAAHITFALPPHRYSGTLKITGSGLQFSGYDTVYLVTGYDRLGTRNREFYRFLCEWL
jgi:hypothetical protein